MKTSSAKQKGRKLQQEVRDKLLDKYILLEEDDIRSTGMGQQGEDIQLSPRAKQFIPFGIECKNQESLSIWSALKQCEKNCKNDIPLLVFKRNRTDIYCTLKFDDLLKLMNKL